jgi:hypothetical protein
MTPTNPSLTEQAVPKAYVTHDIRFKTKHPLFLFFVFYHKIVSGVLGCHFREASWKPRSKSDPFRKKFRDMCYCQVWVGVHSLCEF